MPKKTTNPPRRAIQFCFATVADNMATKQINTRYKIQSMAFD